MKSSLLRRQVFLLVSVVFAVLAVFPHHHHDGGGFCMTVQMCHKDGRINDEHTLPCHNRHVDRHHLFVPSSWRHKAVQAGDVWGGGAGPLLGTALCGIEVPQPSYIVANMCLPHAVAHAAMSCHGRHCKRRGPPHMS